MGKIDDEKERYIFLQFGIDNDIGDEGCKSVSDALASNRTLTYLNLSRMGLKKKIIKDNIKNYIVNKNREQNWK